MKRLQEIPAIGLGAVVALALASFGAHAETRATQPGSVQNDQGRMGHGAPPTILMDEIVAIRLAESPSLAGSDVTVSAAEGGVITLTGKVATQQDKLRAERLARDTRWVTRVDNRLEVDAALAKQQRKDVSDEQLAKQIAQHLATRVLSDAEAEEEWTFGWEVEGDDWEFDVDVDGGQVTLEGTVEDGEDIWKVVDAVRGMPGVASVRADLREDYESYGAYGLPRYDRYGAGFSPYGYVYDAPYF